MWTQHWPLTELRIKGKEAGKIIVDSGGKHPCGSTSILYLPREKGGRGLRSVEQAFWDVPIFAVHEEVTANRVDARIIDKQTKRIITLITLTSENKSQYYTDVKMTSFLSNGHYSTANGQFPET